MFTSPRAGGTVRLVLRFHHVNLGVPVGEADAEAAFLTDYLNYRRVELDSGCAAHRKVVRERGRQAGALERGRRSSPRGAGPCRRRVGRRSGDPGAKVRRDRVPVPSCRRRGSTDRLLSGSGSGTAGSCAGRVPSEALASGCQTTRGHDPPGFEELAVAGDQAVSKPLGSFTARGSMKAPMSRLPLYEMAVRSKAVPATGPMVTFSRIWAPEMYIGKGAARMLEVAKSILVTCERARRVTTEVGSRLARPAIPPNAAWPATRNAGSPIGPGSPGIVLRASWGHRVPGPGSA